MQLWRAVSDSSVKAMTSQFQINPLIYLTETSHSPWLVRLSFLSLITGITHYKYAFGPLAVPRGGNCVFFESLAKNPTLFQPLKCSHCSRTWILSVCPPLQKNLPLVRVGIKTVEQEDSELTPSQGCSTTTYTATVSEDNLKMSRKASLQLRT